MQTTIVAPATAHGQSAVALVRLSGPDSLSILRQITKADKMFPPREQVFCRLKDGEKVLDEALVTYFPAPRSFTGEDVVEFALHGSSYIRGRLLEILCACGAVPAQRGEFSYRAFLNGKMDLTRAEAVMDLVSASSGRGAKSALEQLNGSLYKIISEIQNQVT
ncbi:MAG: hypothetical protein IKJ44_06415, partial [Elusimicrobiaceae bacterium]|nr:hypothetical protein [Elusimicrobiaceae bacterium]